jgi:hypothetical protein
MIVFIIRNYRLLRRHAPRNDGISGKNSFVSFFIIDCFVLLRTPRNDGVRA